MQKVRDVQIPCSWSPDHLKNCTNVVTRYDGVFFWDILPESLQDMLSEKHTICSSEGFQMLTYNEFMVEIEGCKHNMQYIRG